MYVIPERTDNELEVLLIYCCMTSRGSTSTYENTTLLMDGLDVVLDSASAGPFARLRRYDLNDLYDLIRFKLNMGNADSLAETLWTLVNSNINLRTCARKELAKFNYIGARISRMFLLHSRQNQRYAVIDKPVIDFLVSKGVDAPFATLGDGSHYYRAEEIALSFADADNISPAEWDIKIWQNYKRRFACVRPARFYTLDNVYDCDPVYKLPPRS